MNLPIGNTVSEDFLASLIASISDQEIASALHDIAENKTLGIDGFASKFFTHCWDVVGPQVLVAINYFFIKKNFQVCISIHS